MNISEPFIRRPIATSLLAIGLMLTGLVAYRFLPVAPLPQVDFPTINVSATYSGVDPETAATSLAAPLERRFADIAGVNEITSVSQLNGTRITLQFDLSRDINGAARDVQAAINAASSELPPGLPSPPYYRKANPNDTPILILALTSDSVPLSQIYNQAEELLVPAMSQISGVSEVDVGGGAKSAVRIQVDPAALAAMGLSIDNVRSVLQGENKDEPKGSIDGDRISFTMNASDQLFTADQYQNLIIGEKNGVPIPLSAVGRAIDATEDRLQAAWLNSKRAVVMFIRKQADANVIETVDRIKAILPQLQRWLPPAIHLQIRSDRTITIRASVADVQTSLLISIALVAVFIPLLFMGGIIGRQFHEFSVTLSVAILVSAVVSLTLTPMLCSRWLREEKPEQTHGWFYRATEKIFSGMLGIYSTSLRWVLRHSFLMLLVTATTISLTVWLYNVVPKGFFPQQDTGMVFGITEAAQDISFDAMV